MYCSAEQFCGTFIYLQNSTEFCRTLLIGSAEFRRIDLIKQSPADEFCGTKHTRRIPQKRSAQFRRLLQNIITFCSSAEQFCGTKTILRNSAEFRRISWFSPKWSAEFCGTSAEFCRILHGSAELGKITFSNFLISHFWKLIFFNVFCRKLNK